MLKFDLQMFGGGGKGSSSTTSSYTPTQSELTLQGYALNNANNAQSAIGTLTDKLSNSISNGNGFAFDSNAVDYNTLLNNANSNISTGLSNLQNSSNGQLSDALQENLTNSIKSTLANTTGETINRLGNNGVLNSSVTNTANRDINTAAADSVYKNYQNALALQNNTANSLIDNATAGIKAANSAQTAAYTPYANTYNLASGLQNSFITSPLSAMHNGTTTSTKDSGSSLGSSLANAAMLYKTIAML